MSLLASLPAPVQSYEAPEAPAPSAPGSAVHVKKLTKEVPPYGRRQGFVPRRVEDYGDGMWACGNSRDS